MRSWMLFLLLIGVGTAGGLKLWRDRHPDNTHRESTPIEVAEVDATPAEEIAPSVDLDEAPTAPSSDPTVASTPNAAAPNEVDTPGGASAPAEGEARKNALALIEQAGKAQNPIEQARLFTQALKAGALDKAADEKCYADLLAANQRGLLNPRVMDLCAQVEVKKGDSLWAICNRSKKELGAGVTPGLVKLVNGLAKDSIYPGQKLKIPTAAVSIAVSKSRFRLQVFVGELLLRRFDVGTGKDDRTPEGEFTIATRLKDPPWYKPNVGPVPADSPENVLGTRWLGFAAKEGFPEAATFGIHGTRDDASIGTESSNGCVRMHNGEVEELFEWIAEGVKVTITR